MSVPTVVPEGLEMLRAGGTYVEIGGIWPTEVGIDPTRLIWGNRRIVAMTHYHPWVLPRALELLVRTKDRYPFDELLSHRFPLEQVNEAFAAAEWARQQGPATAVVRAALVPS